MAARWLCRLRVHSAALGCGAVAGLAGVAAASAEQPDTFHKRWDEGWQAGRYSKAGTGFHRAQPNPHLVHHKHLLPQGGRVLVPLCGKSVDMTFLGAGGFDVVGVEGSATAIAEFFEESGGGATPAAQPLGAFAARSVDSASAGAGSIQLLEGDFFKLDKESCGQFDAVWDRASMVAIEPELREQYAQTIKAALKPGGVVLLNVVEHPPFEGGRLGPPFSITEQEVRRVYEGDFDVQVLPVPEQSEGGDMSEHDYLLTMR